MFTVLIVATYKAWNIWQDSADPANTQRYRRANCEPAARDPTLRPSALHIPKATRIPNRCSTANNGTVYPGANTRGHRNTSAESGWLS